MKKQIIDTRELIGKTIKEVRFSDDAHVGAFHFEDGSYVILELEEICRAHVHNEDGTNACHFFKRVMYEIGAFGEEKMKDYDAYKRVLHEFETDRRE